MLIFQGVNIWGKNSKNAGKKHMNIHNLKGLAAFARWQQKTKAWQPLTRTELQQGKQAFQNIPLFIWYNIFV